MLYTTKLIETSITPCACVTESDAKLKRSAELSFGLLMTILNIVEILIIVKIKRRNTHNILLLSLSVSDCMFGLSNSFVWALYIARVCRLGDLFETAYTSRVFFVLSSVLHLLFITVGRLIAVLKPVQHTVSLSRRFYVYIAVLWIFAVLTTALLQILDEFTDTFTRNRLVSRTLNQTSEATPFSNLCIPSKFALLTASPRYNLLTVTEKKNFSEWYAIRFISNNYNSRRISSLILFP